MTGSLRQVLASEPNQLLGQNSKALDYSADLDSESYQFYNGVFSSDRSTEAVKVGSAVKEENLSECPTYMVDLISFLKEEVNSDAVIIEFGGSKYQRRSGFPYSCFENYFPLDISATSMVAYSELFDRESIACDAQKVPFKDSSIDVIFTHTFLEHPINPDAVVKEIHRILKPGGLVIHLDAWHCRWWQRFGIYGIKPFKSLPLKEKLLYCLIAVDSFKYFRIPRILVKRLFKELFITKSKPRDLLFKPLKPNYDLDLYSDEDAAASIDPLDLIRFYESRGYSLLRPIGFFQRLFYNEIGVRIRKSRH